MCDKEYHARANCPCLGIFKDFSTKFKIYLFEGAAQL